MKASFLRPLGAGIASVAMAAGLALLPAAPAWACASCGCSVNADWGAQGWSTAPGWSLDLRHDIVSQNQLRSGRHGISAGAASQTGNPTTGGPAEVETGTLNRYTTASLDYSDGRAWGVTVQLPWVDRHHGTLGTGSDGVTPAAGGGAYVSQTSGIGDVRLIGRYDGLSESRDIGLQFGVKLPTGRFGQTGTSTDPATAGASAAIDRGLQAGTGTTDAIVGVYGMHDLDADWSVFAQATYQVALNRRNDYRPGNALSVNLGTRYHGFESATPIVQLNLRHAQSDSGATADSFATGGTLVYFSPGVYVPLSDAVTVYGFVQVPVYQQVAGVQLTPKLIVSVGTRFSF